MNKTKLIILGPVGCGKSTTGNNLLRNNVFTSGRDVASITHNIQKGENEHLLVIDCPGFGDHSDEVLFIREFLAKENALLNYSPINAFLLVIKFDINTSEGFLYAARDFVKSFGSPAIKSLVLVCIQSNLRRRYGNADFERVLKNSDGYKYLKKENENLEIQWCLWENIQNEYPNQLNNLFDCVYLAQPFNRDFMKYSIELIKIKYELTNTINKLKTGISL